MPRSAAGQRDLALVAPVHGPRLSRSPPSRSELQGPKTLVRYCENAPGSETPSRRSFGSWQRSAVNPTQLHALGIVFLQPVSAASSLAETFRWSLSPTCLLVSTGSRQSFHHPLQGNVLVIVNSRGQSQARRDDRRPSRSTNLSIRSSAMQFAAMSLSSNRSYVAPRIRGGFSEDSGHPSDHRRASGRACVPAAWPCRGRLRAAMHKQADRRLVIEIGARRAADRACAHAGFRFGQTNHHRWPPNHGRDAVR